MFSNIQHRGPIQPMMAMLKTGRYYITEIYTTKPNGQRIKLSVTQWSPDNQAHTLVHQLSTMGKTTLRPARKGEC